MSRLAYRDRLPPRVVGQLAVGASGFLVFNDRRIPVGLRVAARASPPDLEAAVIDRVGLAERRHGGTRLGLVTRVRIACPDEPDGDRSDWTETINLSERGALLRQHPALDADRRVTLELMFGDDPRPITAQAEVTRRSPDAVGVAFDAIPTDDERRLGEYLMGLRHARRAALGD
ncbi:MAG TPA: PilZ domain-containing protein [Solirubrobacteraceae bacterium]|nr:PilZ domain-containing protein [Solirubrobacteraceae bacterium]